MATTKYYVNGKEITEAEATAINKRNNEILNSGDFAKMSEIKFIVKIG